MRNFTRRLSYTDGSNSEGKAKHLAEHVKSEFTKAMDDDLNVGSALAALFEFVREVNNLIDANSLSKEEAREIYDLIVGFDKVIGVIGGVKEKEKLPKEAEELVLKREEARKAKDWKKADEIRKQLKNMGIIIEDTAQGIKWRIEKH